MSDLAGKSCVPCSGKTIPLSNAEAQELLTEIPGWSICPGGRVIERDFIFDDFHATMAFVNAMAWIAHRQNHHPDFETGYRHCLVRLTTHAIDGLSGNDFICAARINDLLEH